ncbi:unnamed protein product [Rotaria sordida]|uniref:Uncharacterized protein n=1 Tax=Rotaria sordida TaxID=392033 RepID=A0A820JYA7_9BILA|nr:unnamed protein product [Rotaria sordida]
MHMGILANIAAATPSNFKHSQDCGYKYVMIATNQFEINEAMEKIRAINSDGPILLELRIQTGHRKNLGRPTRSTDENRQDFMHFLQLN